MALLKKQRKNPGSIQAFGPYFVELPQNKVSTGHLNYRIMERLLENVIYDDQKESVCWTSVRFLGIGETQWQIIPMDIYPYDGIGGVAVYVNACLRFAQEQHPAWVEDLYTIE